MRKIFISPSDKKAIAFLNSFEARKATLKLRVEAKLESIAQHLRKTKSTTSK